MSTLLGRLAQFGSFWSQGELLCTQGLAYLLQEHPSARSALAAEIETRTGVRVGNDLKWHAELVQEQDRGRPDLVGQDSGRPIVKIEAKLGAGLSTAQFQSYVDHFLLSVADSAQVLLVLVPRGRTDEAKKEVAKVFAPSGASNWQLGKVTIAVISWEDLLAKLQEAEADPLRRYEVEQLKEMYRALSGNDIPPLAGPDDLIHWRKKGDVFVTLVERVTRLLTDKHASSKVLPMGTEQLEQPAPEGLEDKGYRRRYVCLGLEQSESCFSIGVRDPFASSDPPTPIWLRFNHGTPQFSVIRDRLERSHLAPKLVPSGKNIWLPLYVPTGVDGEHMLNEVVAQAEEVIQVVYKTHGRTE